MISYKNSGRPRLMAPLSDARNHSEVGSGWDAAALHGQSWPVLIKCKICTCIKKKIYKSARKEENKQILINQWIRSERRTVWKRTHVFSHCNRRKMCFGGAAGQPDLCAAEVQWIRFPVLRSFHHVDWSKMPLGWEHMLQSPLASAVGASLREQSSAAALNSRPLEDARSVPGRYNWFVNKKSHSLFSHTFTKFMWEQEAWNLIILII